MRLFKIGGSKKLEPISTTTTEFAKMQLLYQEMIDKIETEYYTLKEYTENMAHEIQTPLTLIRNKAENLISDEEVMKNHSAAVKTIYDETNHLSKLGTALNLLTKVEHGEYSNKIELKTKPVIEKHIESITELTGLKGLEMMSDLNDEHELIIDPLLFDIIIKNLLRNAIMYGNNSGPIKLFSDKNRLSISNFGEKLPFEEEKLFTRFHGHSSSKNSLGLGLALVKKICDLNSINILYKFEEQQHTFILEQKKS